MTTSIKNDRPHRWQRHFRHRLRRRSVDKQFLCHCCSPWVRAFLFTTVANPSTSLCNISVKEIVWNTRPDDERTSNKDHNPNTVRHGTTTTNTKQEPITEAAPNEYTPRSPQTPTLRKLTPPTEPRTQLKTRRRKPTTYRTEPTAHRPTKPANRREPMNRTTTTNNKQVTKHGRKSPHTFDLILIRF